MSQKGARVPDPAVLPKACGAPAPEEAQYIHRLAAVEADLAQPIHFSLHAVERGWFYRCILARRYRRGLRLFQLLNGDESFAVLL